MAGDGLRERIADQFSYRGERANVWRGIDLLLETEAYLNLGYSPWYLPHLVGSSQRRLARVVGSHLAAHLPQTESLELLDVGCGRGGPATELGARHGFGVTGVDLVQYNVRRATENARECAGATSASFVVGDATRLPIAPGSMGACTSVDALVYVPDRAAALAEIADACRPGAVIVVSDLLAAADLDAADRQRVDAFASAWDMPPLGTRLDYAEAFDAAGFDLLDVVDLTPNSVGRLPRWTAPFLALADSPAGGLVDRLLARLDLDASAVRSQVRRAHEALPVLRHTLFVARRRERGRKAASDSRAESS